MIAVDKICCELLSRKLGSLSQLPLRLSVCLSVCLFQSHLPLSPNACLSQPLSLSVSLYRSICLSVCLPVCLPQSHLPLSPNACLSQLLSPSLSLSVSLYRSICLSVCLSLLISLYLSSTSVCVSVYLNLSITPSLFRFDSDTQVQVHIYMEMCVSNAIVFVQYNIDVHLEVFQRLENKRKHLYY